MFGPTFRSTGRGALAVGILVLAFGQARAEDQAAQSEPVKIGMIGTLFRDVPETTVLIMMAPFGAVMQAQTGVSGELVPGGDAESVGERLATDKLQLAVFHGIEFAWARQKHPELRPLVIAINLQRHLRAHLIVRADNPATSLKDLHDQPFVLPRQSREHCHLFVERQCQGYKKEPRAFFSKITTPASSEEALDDVLDGVAQATVIDGVSLDCYKRRKPGRFTKLKVLETSEVFPAAVVAYKPGALDEATLKRFREGMMTANQSILGRQLLTMWKLTGFEPVPQDYEQTLTEIVESYPAPVKSSK
jgi:ABC-type phosphate/phosphonate transport system substrate-binding protein